MRADRLVAALLFLQARGRVTAGELADELEVSERTARRDLEALATSGVPVYSQPGRGGGWSLVGGARTDLSGLSAAEARTLFLVAGPAAATPTVKAALRKLLAALPETLRAQAEAAATAVVIDPTGWDHRRPDPPAQLEVLQQAVIDGVKVRIGYAGRNRPEGERTVHPLGLVAKRSVWYLIADTDAGLRTFRVSRVTSVALTDRPVVRPDGFDLEATWRAALADLDEIRLPTVVTLFTEPQNVLRLRGSLGLPVTETGRSAGDRVEVEVRGHSPWSLAAQLAGLAGAIEVVGPPDVLDRLRQIASELSVLYGP
ncbi:MAG TPA: WYL domain-containing protein [Acidimicrobiales bacterium]|nr:WYL domain-containing protein [Acidimicrobiales bacterium]